MRIQHNIMAMNAYRNYNTNTSALSKNLEKLSSGYKINRAGDDAAGLAISEKMRAQITGLSAAQKNVKDGISLVKTAEGAMQEIQDMLNRMDYLATQSANGTYDDPVDRLNLQKEVNQLRSEINRIADSANFNGIKLLNGDMSLAEAESADVTVDVATVTSNVGTAAGGGTVTDLTANFAPSGNAIDGLHPGVTVASQVAPSFSVNLGSVTFAGVTDNAAGDVFTITIGTVAVTAAVSVATAGDDLSAADLATAFDGVTFNLGGVEFTIDDLGGGKLGFQATTASTADTHATSINAIIEGAKVNVGSAVTGVSVKGGDWVHGLQDITKAVDSTAGKLSGASFDLSKNNSVVDGAKLTIGDQEYTFRVGANSAVTAGDPGVIDLSKYEAGNPELYKQAAIELAKSATTITDAGHSNTTFKISSVQGSVIHIDQQPAAGQNVTYSADMLKGLFSVVKPTTTEAKASIELSGTPNTADLADGDLVAYNGKTYTIGTAPEGAKNADSYITAASFNQLLQDDATQNLLDAANSVIAASYSGLYTATTNASGNVVIQATEGRDSDHVNQINQLISDITAAAGKVQISKIDKDNVSKGGLTLQIGDTSDSFNQLRVNVGDMHVDAMGTMETLVEGGKQTAVAGKSIDDIDISTLKGAQDAIDVIKNAINYVSSVRGDLGATQNRLEHTANNLSVMAENIQDAESTIRDTDVAEEMMAYTKNNILVQSAQAMLAQANAVPQGVLQLLG